MKVLGDTSIPTFAAWGNTAFGSRRDETLVGEVFRNVILPVARNAHRDPGPIEFG